MIKHSFVHIRGVGQTTEQRLWSAGITEWSKVPLSLPKTIPGWLRHHLPDALTESHAALRQRDGRYFASRLGSQHLWRLYPEFMDDVAFFDIETTGLSPAHHHVTTIAVYDGKDVRTFVRGRNLDEFPNHIRRYRLLVTYNGKQFDVPFLRTQFDDLPLDQAHIDLRFVLAALGYRGGLKGCERQLGLDRGAGLRDVDGFMAVRLWRAHERGDRRALPALLRYNVEDVVNLKWLMETAYNMAVSKLPIDAEPLFVVPPYHTNQPFDPSIIDELGGQDAVYERTGL